MGAEEKARSLVAHMHADQTDAQKTARLAEALRDAEIHGAREAASYATREASTVLQQSGVDEGVVATLCSLYNRVRDDPSLVLDHDEEDGA